MTSEILCEESVMGVEAYSKLYCDIIFLDQIYGSYHNNPIKYCIYLALRRNFHFSRMTINN